MTMVAVDPANWTSSLNPDTNELLLDGTDYLVQNADKTYSITSPSTGVMQFQVESGDVWSPVDTATKNRSEIASTTVFTPATQINVSYGFNLLPGSVSNSSWCVVGQFHELNNDGNSPPLEIDLVGQKMAVQVDYLNSSGAEVYHQIYLDSQNIVEGHNYAMNIQVTFNANGTGHVVVIRDGVTLVNYTGQMGFAANPDVYWKEGIYRSASTSTMTVDYSNLHITTGTPSAPPPAPAPVAPTTVADSYAATSGVALVESAAKGVLANDTDHNGLTLKAALAANGGPAHGTLVLNADGSFTYTPTAGYVGTDTFTYIASDSLSTAAATTVTLNVGGPVVIGGHGNDTYYVSNSAEQIVVAAGTPNETVIANVSYALPANIQNLILKGSGLTGTANAMNDSLTSSGGPNTLVGGSGTDTFYVNNVGDKVVVGPGHSADVVISTVSYTVPDNVACLRLAGTGLTATGNAAGHNYMTSLNGGNTLVGSAVGNDVFSVAHSNDVIVVAAGAVNDTVNAWSSFSLPANVQNLVGEGTAAITLVGNSMANSITANSGADTLTGGGGADTFVVGAGDKLETITDFSSSDRIDISAFLAKGMNPTFHDFTTYSTVSFSNGDVIKLLGVHASSLELSGHYVV